MDYYKQLNIVPSATKDEVIESYKSLLKQYKPDSLNSLVSTSQFKKIFESYYILSEDFRRENYNKFYFSNRLESKEFNLWRRNQFKKIQDSTNKDNYSFIDGITSEFFGEIVIGGIAEIVGSIFD